MKKNMIKILLLSGVLLITPWAYATDSDNDGSDDVEENYAGTDINDADERPFWWKTLNGVTGSMNFGTAIDDVGDINGDGYDDFIVGASSDDTVGSNAGMATVFSGFDSTVLFDFYGKSGEIFFGWKVANAGDVNNDGTADFIIGGLGISAGGVARVYSGADGSELYEYYGANASDFLSTGVAGIGDINGDNYADFIIGASGFDATELNDSQGRAYVYSGYDGTALYILDGDQAGDNFGFATSAAGDMNNDGVADFVVAAPFNDVPLYNGGFIRIFSGVDGTVLYTLYGNASEEFASTMTPVGDVNNDNYDDLAVGVPGDDNGGNNIGSLQVVSGIDGSTLYTVYGTEPGEQFGRSVSNLDDLNGDGVDEVLVGAPYFDAGATSRGYARILSGIDGAELYRFQGDAGGDQFGYAVSATGDVDNDGYGDFAIGAQYDDNTGTSSGSVRLFLYVDLANDLDLDYLLNGPDPDMENDGMPDIWEDSYGLDSTVDDTAEDLDGDGATNIDEYLNGFDPSVVDNDPDGDGLNGLVDNCPSHNNADQLDTDLDGEGDACDSDDDNDGMPDVWENTYGLNPLLDDTGADLDGDGASNIDEYLNGLDPSVVDNDPDADGVNNLVDNCPTDINTSQIDTDLDGDGDVCDSDDDNDGMPDVWETLYGLNPLQDDNNLDLDNDGWTNWTEYNAATDPSVFDDMDADGSSAFEESIVGSSDNDAQRRPAWWRTINGDSESMFFGAALENIGDVNLDGLNDIIASSDAADTGGVWVLSGADGAILYRYDTSVTPGYSTRFGSVVAAAGDVDNDGYADFAFSIREYDTNNDYRISTLVVYSGYDGSNIHTLVYDHPDNGNGSLIKAVDSLGDINGDNYDDFAVGLPYDDTVATDSGAVHVYSGIDGSELYSVYGNVESDQFGRAISSGDTDNNGITDFAVGTYQLSGFGYVKIFNGVDGVELRTFDGMSEGVSAGDLFGAAVDASGDMNADGYTDIIIGSPHEDQAVAGAVGVTRVYSGADGSLLHTLYPEWLSGATFGDEIAVAGDIDDDGYDDVLIGTDNDSTLGGGTGAMYLFSGQTGERLYYIIGDKSGERCGASVAGIGDLDGDNIDDFMVSAKSSDYNFPSSGSVRIYLSSDLANDSDLDGWFNVVDAFPDDGTEWLDTDSDTVGDNTDNCVTVENSSQDNFDNDEMGDACDGDDDNDGVQDVVDGKPLNAGYTLEVALPIDGQYKGIDLGSKDRD